MTTYGDKRYVSVCCPVHWQAVRFLTLSSTEQKCCRTALSVAILYWLRDNVVWTWQRLREQLILSEVVYHFGPYDRFVDVFTLVDQLDLRYA
jgi:hypothetical protein